MLKLDAAGHLAYKRLPPPQMISPISLGRAYCITIVSSTLMAITVAVFAAPEETANSATQIQSVLRRSRILGTGAMSMDS
jgi:hypothetical protein